MMLEHKLGQQIKYAYDCQTLMFDIEKHTRQRIGLNTIKRLMGFLENDIEPRKNTLDIIAIYLGFLSWDKMNACISENGNSTFDDTDEDIVSPELPTGTIIEFDYDPQRTVRLKHISGDEFLVEKSVNSKLIKGDHIWVSKFIMYCPLYADKVVRNNSDMGRFTAGKEGGLQAIRILKKEDV